MIVFFVYRSMMRNGGALRAAKSEDAGGAGFLEESASTA